MTCYHSQNSNLNINLLYCLSNTNHRLAKSVCKIFVVALAFSDCKLVVVKFIIVFVMLQFDWLCDVHGCVMSPTLGIYWVDLGFINNYKESQLWLVLLWLSQHLVIFNIELRYYMCVHSKMGVDNFVVLQICEKLKF